MNRFIIYLQRFCFLVSVTIQTLCFYQYYFYTVEGLEQFSQKIISRSPLLIKIAQWFSTREDMIEIKKRRILQKFQSFAPIDGYDYILRTIEKDTAISISDITELSRVPIASGSVAQVHRCKYQGKSCALKIIHEEAELLLIDLGIAISFLNFFSFFIAHLRSINYEDIFMELAEQTDLKKEYQNYQAVGKNVRKTPNIVVPKVYQASKNCLAMEFYEGLRFDQLLKSEQTEMRKNMICLFYKMVLRDKLCHGDFHPGNFLFKKKGSRIEMCVLDFGVTHHIERKTQKALYYLYRAIASEKYEDYQQFFGNALESNPFLDEIMPHIISDFQDKIDEIKKKKIPGKGNTPAYIKAAFRLVRKYNEIFSGTVFNMLLQILMLHENVDVKGKNKSIFMEAFNHMQTSSYYVGQLGYKIKTMKEALLKAGYDE